MALGVIDQSALAEIGKLKSIGLDGQLGGPVEFAAGIECLGQAELQLNAGLERESRDRPAGSRSRSGRPGGACRASREASRASAPGWRGSQLKASRNDRSAWSNSPSCSQTCARLTWHVAWPGSSRTASRKQSLAWSSRPSVCKTLPRPWCAAGETRLELDRCPIVADRGFEVSRAHQGQGQVAVNVGVVGVEPQGGSAAVDGSVVVAERAIGFAEVGVDHRRRPAEARPPGRSSCTACRGFPFWSAITPRR